MTRALIQSERLCAWHGQSLLVVSLRGDCDAGDALSGYYFREARFLRTLRLEINGKPPWLCEAAQEDPTTLRFNYISIPS